MESLLNPISTKAVKKTNASENGERAPETLGPDTNQQSLPRTPEAAINVLSHQPSIHSLSQALQYLSKTCFTKHADGFNILLPNPKSAQIVFSLVNDILPHFWPALSKPKNPEEVKSRKRLLQCLRSSIGLGALLTCLRSKIDEIRGNDNKGNDALEIFCDFLQQLLHSDDFLIVLWNSLHSFEIRYARAEMSWKEIVNVIASGRLISNVAESEALLKERSIDIQESIWVADGIVFASWLGRNLLHMIQNLDENHWGNGGQQSVLLCFSRALGLGYTNYLVGETFRPLLNGEEDFLPRLRALLHGLSGHQQQVTIFSIIRNLSKSELDRETIRLEAAAKVLSELCSDDQELLKHLVAWLSATSAEAINFGNSIHRAVILALSTNPALLNSTLAKVMETFNDKLHIKHSPILYQEVNTQILLLLLGHVYQAEKQYVLKIAKSSTYLSSISNHLAATSPKSRFLGMVVGSTVSKKIDAAGTQLTFKAEDSQTTEWLWYQRLFDIQEKVGKIEDLRLKGGAAFRVEKQTPKQKTRNAKSKTEHVPASASKIVAIEDIGDASKSEDDDLPAYAKPDSDPSDSDDDPTLVRREKIRVPVYVRDVVAGLRDIENYDIHKLALQNGPSIIRRKTGYGTEVHDHLEELASIIVGMKDRWELDEFPKLRLQGILALLVADPKTMGPWLSQSFYTGDYSLSQRAAILTALGLGAREIAGIAGGDDTLTGAIHSKDAFPSKRLPPNLDSYYAGEAAPLNTLTSRLSKGILQPLAASAADQVTGPDVLKVRTFSSRMEVEKKRTKPTSNPLAKIVAESFFIPLTGRWQIQTQVMGENAPQASPMLLSQLLKTLSLILHAAGPTTPALPQLTSEFWGFLLAVRTKAEDRSVLDALLFALLTLLDVNSENQRRVAEEHGRELLETQEWVNDVLGRIGGGEEEGENCRMLAAGVLVKCRAVVDKYHRLLMGDMIDFRS